MRDGEIKSEKKNKYNSLNENWKSARTHERESRCASRSLSAFITCVFSLVSVLFLSSFSCFGSVFFFLS